MDLNTFLFVLGRILFGGYFVVSGLNHLTKLSMLTGYARSKKVPSPRLAVVVSGFMILLGGAGIILGVKIGWSVALLAVFLIVVTFKMHAFWRISDPNQRMSEQVNFMKNLALLGAVFLILQITDWPVGYGSY